MPFSAMGMLPWSLGLIRSCKLELCFGLHQPLLVPPRATPVAHLSLLGVLV